MGQPDRGFYREGFGTAKFGANLSESFEQVSAFAR